MAGRGEIGGRDRSQNCSDAGRSDKNLNEDTITSCRACEGPRETIGHILSHCPNYHWTLFTERHNRVLYLLVKAVLTSLKLGIPESMRGPGGVAVAGVTGGRGIKVLVDQLIPTSRTVIHRKPDLVVRMEEERRVVIFEVACAWDRGLKEREVEKRGKYQELAADLATQERTITYKVVVVPVVLGDLGTITGLKKNLKRAKLLTDEEMDRFMASAQREVLCAAIKITKRHFTTDT